MGENYVITPLLTDPQNVSLSDYDIKWDNSTGIVNDIVNKKHGPVVFEASIVDGSSFLIET